MISADRTRTRFAAHRFAHARRIFRIEYTQLGPMRVSARVAGDLHSQHTIVLLPGLGLAGRYMLPLGAALAPDFRVFVPVVPGFGRSQRPPNVLDLPGMGAVVADWLAASGIEAATLVGNSMGCQVAIETARCDPGRISGIVLDAPTVDSQARTLHQLTWRIARDALREPPSLAVVQAGEWIATGPRTLIGTTRFALAHRPEQRIADVACPVLIVRSARDPFVPHRWTVELAGATPRATLHEEHRGTHALPYSDPDQLAGIVRDFIGR